MPGSKSRFDKATSSADEAEVRIVIRPDNVALLYPPAEDLPPLLPYRKFAIEEQPGDEALDEPGLSAGTAFPAGLVPYLEAALAADGHDVTIDDRRRAAPGLAADKQFYRDSTGPERAFLRVVRRNPLGQITWTDWADIPWRLWGLTALYPRARFLIAEATRAGRSDLYGELRDRAGDAQGLVPDGRSQELPRCLVVTFGMLAVLTPGRWQIVVPVIRHGRVLTETAYRAVLRHRARRTYTFVRHGLELAGPAQLRLEAMSGPVLGGNPPPDGWSATVRAQRV
jgi:hypothetical protein